MFPRPSRVTRLSVLVLSLFLLAIFLYMITPGGEVYPSVVDHKIYQAMGVTSLASVALPSTPRHLTVSHTRSVGKGGSNANLPPTPAPIKHVNPHDFQYLHNPSDVCRGGNKQYVQHSHSNSNVDNLERVDERNILKSGPVDLAEGNTLTPMGMAFEDQAITLLIYIHSAPGNLKKRQAVRQSWAQPILLRRLGAAAVFLLGRPTSVSQQQMIDLEANTYGDIVQEDFVDHYRNLTYKGVAGLRWVTSFCPSAIFLLKTDDDILVDIVTLVSSLKKRHPAYSAFTTNPGISPAKTTHSPPKDVVLCNLWTRMKVMRDPKSKWYIPSSEFGPDYFPPYCSGSAFVLSAELAPRLFQASLDAQFFWVDDYYITGLLVNTLGVKHARNNQAYLLNANLAEKRLVNGSREEIFFHVKKLSLFLKLWPMLLRRHEADPELKKLLPVERPTPQTIIGEKPDARNWKSIITNETSLKFQRFENGKESKDRELRAQLLQKIGEDLINFPKGSKKHSDISNNENMLGDGQRADKSHGNVKGFDQKTNISHTGDRSGEKEMRVK